MGVDFAAIYATDLVYTPGCWKLCGDAHCCSFARHKAKFRMLGRTAAQELPLLPGEYVFLARKGWLGQFGDHTHRRIDFAFDGRSMTIESIVSQRTGCACDHATRPAICRLYPVLPVFDETGRLTAIDSVGIYDRLEAMDGLERACRIDSVPLSELQKLLAITSAIAADPVALFYAMAYRIAHEHVEGRLMALRGDRGVSYFQVFEGAALRGRLIDTVAFGMQLGALADRFDALYGTAFRLGRKANAGSRAAGARAVAAPPTLA